MNLSANSSPVNHSERLRCARLSPVLTWLAGHQVWLLAGAAPLLFFPHAYLPWLGLGVICLGFVAHWVVTGRLADPTIVDPPIFLLIVLAVLGLVIALEPSLSWPRFWSLLLGILVFYTFVNDVRSERRALSLVYLLGALTLVAAALSLVGTDWSYAHMLPIPWLYDRIPSLIPGLPGSGISMSGDMFNPRFVGITMGFLSPLFFAFMLFAQDKRLRIFSALVFLLASLLLLLSQSPQGFAAYLAGIFTILVWRSRWWLVLIPLSILVMGVVVYAYGPQPLLLDLLSLDNFAGKAIVLRLDIWSRAHAMLHDLPFTGIGLNNYPLILSNFYPGFLLGPEPHAHNLYLQTALDFGILGLVALSWLVIAWALAVRRNYRASQLRDYRLLLVGLFACLVAYLVHGFFDALMLGAKPGVALWLLLALGAAIPLEHSSASPADQVDGRARFSLSSLPRWTPLALIPFALILSFVLFPTAWRMDLGALRAHRLLYQLRQGAQDAILVDRASVEKIASTRKLLGSVVENDPGRVFAYELLAQLDAWVGDYPSALTHLDARLGLDSLDPWRAYFPPEAILRALGSPSRYQEGDLDALQVIYTHWMNRYPQRAEGYLHLALLSDLQGAGPQRAMNLLQAGIQNDAQPLGLLQYAISFYTP